MAKLMQKNLNYINNNNNTVRLTCKASLGSDSDAYLHGICQMTLMKVCAV